MTKEEKLLLLKDLCARLPYGVKGIITYDKSNTTFTVEGIDNNVLHLSDAEDCYVEDFKPYLRPMSSMTEEEWKELNCIGNIVPLYDGFFGVDMRAYCKNGQPHYRRFSEFSTIEDWLNAHHFDFRGLISMGLAIEAPKGMYN